MVPVGNMSNREAIEFRLATEADLLELRSLYAETVDELGPTAYTPAQVAAWKAFADDPGFDDFILEVHTYVAVSDVQAVGFCGIADDGHVASVYVGPAYCRQGVGSMLLTWALTRHPVPTSGRYYAEASAFSLPLFERCGFGLVGTEQTIRNGVAFERFLVERIVGPSGQGGGR